MIFPESVRLLVSARALHRCEYCLVAETETTLRHEIDHIISRKHGGTGEPDNLALACFLCNRFKGSDISSVLLSKVGLVPLFNPRKDAWTEHFRIVGAVIEPLTDIGEVTARLLRFNQASRVIERKYLQNSNRYPRNDPGKKLLWL